MDFAAVLVIYMRHENTENTLACMIVHVYANLECINGPIMSSEGMGYLVLGSFGLTIA